MPTCVRCLFLFFFFLVFNLSDVQSRPPPQWGHRDKAYGDMEAIKQTILSQLGLETRPAIRKSLDADVVRDAWRRYQEIQTQLQANRTWTPDPIVHYLWPTVKLMEPDASEGQPGQLYSLEVSRTATLRRDLHVLRAELTLFGNVTGAHVYKLDGGQLNRNHIPTVSVSPSTLTLDLRDSVSAWLAGPEPSLHLVLAFSIPVEFEQMMEVETRERQRPVRKVRQAQQVDTEDEECSKGEGKCCLRSLKVSFEAIGWSDWVVAPRSYSMKFCQGSCPHNYKPASIHAQIKARLHSLSGEAPAPCCVPAGYEPMVLMHYGDDGKVVAQVFEDMIVTRCHCA